MNRNLLTPAEKAENRLGRNRRNARRQARRRRERLLLDLINVVGVEGGSVADLASPEECLEILTAHLRRSRAIVTRVRRVLAASRLANGSPGFAATPESLARPSRVLRAGNRGQVLPGLLDGAIPHEVGSTIEGALATTRRHVDQGVSHFVVLDLLAGSSRLPWPAAAELLVRHRIVPTRISSVEIEATRCARAFWNRYDDARRVYRAAVASREITANAGDWALLHDRDLDALLPGVRLPGILRRQAYLANLVRDRASLCMDLYSCPSKLPLIRHPF